ncbi:response regulator [Oxalobacteraceae bacterium]|nr:response regulator [Oxalobacteraceae bacterium]
MHGVITWLETLCSGIPLSMLEVWGGFAYLLGLLLMASAFAGVTGARGGHWGLGRLRQSWDQRALLSMAITFAAVFISGYLGSAIVLVPGAQTFESLKDLSVFLCIVLFGYPALIIVPFAYGLSDLVEGVAPGVLLEWLSGYFINPACFWVAHQLIGRQPDFRRLRTWCRYLLFVALFLALEPALWGYLTSSHFTPGIAYRHLVPALLFTTGLTWLLAPAAMLVALPLARRYGLFWADIPNHVRVRAFGSEEWNWTDRQAVQTRRPVTRGAHRVPIRVLLAVPLCAMVMLLVGVTAWLTLGSAETAAFRLASRLHQEIAENINLQLDDYLAGVQKSGLSLAPDAVGDLLRRLPMAQHGRAAVIDRRGLIIASSAEQYRSGQDNVLQKAVSELVVTLGTLSTLQAPQQLQFDIIDSKPLGRERWLMLATPYQDRGGSTDWIVLTAMPESFYLEGVRNGNSRSAMVFALALLLALAAAIVLSAAVTAPLRRLARATRALARGDLSQRVPGSVLDELGALSYSFNHMAGRLQQSFDDVSHLANTLATREQSLEQSERRYRTLYEDVPIPLFRATHLGQLDELNDAGMILLGLQTREQMRQTNIFGLYLDPIARRRWQEGLTSGAGLSRRAEVLMKRADNGRALYVNVVARGVYDPDTGQITFIEGSIEDITDRKNAEEELRRHREQLEHTIAERTSALQVALTRAEAANRAKSVFLSNMSHELRTPLNSVIGFSQLLAGEEAITPQQRDKLGMINRSGHHLLVLINDILELSKIETGRVELQLMPVDLSSLLDAALEMVQLRATQNGVALNLQCGELPAVVLADSAKLRQVLLNLLSNAVKFAGHGNVTLAVRAVPLQLQRVRLHFAVSDTGAGIAEQDRERIFEPFVQADTPATQAGTGLGLAISREFVQLMGGELQLETELGSGSTFSFALELEQRPGSVIAAPPGRVTGLPSNQRGRSVLVVDDNREGRELLRKLLEPLGFAVHEAVDGIDGGERILALQPDLVFMDWRMPRLDGLSLTREIRANRDIRQPRIVILTASAFEEERLEALASGADDFMRKPLELDKLFALLELHLNLHFEREQEAAVEAIPAGPLGAADLAVLDGQARIELKQAVANMDLAEISLLLQEVSEEQPLLAARVRQMLEQGQYPQLWKLLDAPPQAVPADRPGQAA